MKFMNLFRTVDVNGVEVGINEHFQSLRELLVSLSDASILNGLFEFINCDDAILK